MRYLPLSLLLSCPLLPAHWVEAGTEASPADAAPTGRLAPPGKFGRWVNRRTKPVGRVLEKVTPFHLVKKPFRPRFVGGCCFPADTRISLPGGATCAIGELRVGQAVLGWNPATGRLDTARVLALAAVTHDSLRRLTFAGGRTITATADHPFWVSRAGWASLAPAQTAARYAIGPTRLLHPGDSCLAFTGAARPAPTPLREVATLPACGVPTYTITRLSRGHVFFANGLAVGVEDYQRPALRRRRPAGPPL